MVEKNKERKPMQTRVTFMTKHFPECEQLHDLGLDVQKVMAEVLSKALPVKLRQIIKEKELRRETEEELIRELLKDETEK